MAIFLLLLFSPLKVREVSLTKPDTLRHSWLLHITEHRAWHNPRNIIGTTPGTLFLEQVKCMRCPNSQPYKIVHRIVQLGPNELLTNQMTRRERKSHHHHHCQLQQSHNNNNNNKRRLTRMKRCVQNIKDSTSKLVDDCSLQETGTN